MTQSLRQEHDTSGTDRAQDHAEYRFDCPDLPDAFFVIEFAAVDALNTPYRWTVRLRPEHEATEADQLLGRDAMLSIVVRGEERFFRGIVDRVTTAHDAHSRQQCDVTVVPALASLGRTLGTRIFQDMTALQIVEQVLRESLGPYGRTFDSASIDPSRFVARNYCVQYRETNLAFVHRLLEEEGIGYCFSHDGETEALFLFDDNRSLQRPSAPEANPVQFWTASSDGRGHERMMWFPTTANRTSTRFVTRDYDWRLGGRKTLEHTSAISPPSARSHEIYEHGVGQHHVIHEDTNVLLGMGETLLTSLVAANLPAPLADRISDLKGSTFDRFSTSNTDDRGRVRREWHQRDARVLEGLSCIPALSAGTAFELAGHPAPGVDGEYFVTSITHSSSPPPSSLSGGEQFHLNYHNRVHCLPRATQWRPDCVTPKPRIEGVQTATVTGPPGLDVYTDPHGRIRVQFPWDRASADLGGHYTCWLRVSQAWAGATSPAFLFIPRVGMEVVVSFIDGDPDRPLATGCVYNGDNPTPALLPIQATKSIIRTRTIPMGPGYNELSFEDAMGMERVHLRAQRDLSELVHNNHDVRILRNERISIGADQSETVGRDQVVDVGRHYKRTTRGRAVEVTGGDHSRSVEGTANERIATDYRVEVEGIMSTRAPQVVTHAGHAITVSQGEVSLLRMTDLDNTANGGPGKGMTLVSEGSKIYLTKDRIELTVGGSSLVITPELIQVNGKTLPAVPGEGTPTS